MHRLRVLRLLLLALFDRSARDPLRPVTFRLLITPFDVELTRAASHSYAAFAGLGRWAWSFRNIDWNGLLRERWVPLTQSELTQYRRACRIFTFVDVTTTVLWWDEKMAYFEHRITQGDTVSAIVFSRGAFFKGKERVPAERLVKGLPAVPPMPRPALVDYWNVAQEHFQRALNEAR
jgi:hypothetical protein